MINRFSQTLLLTLLLSNVSRPSVSQTTPSDHLYPLTIDVANVANSRGVVGVLVFSSPAGWPENISAAFRSEAVPAQQGVTTITIPDLPAGEYAAVVLHDENENMKLDRNWIGAPKEQWGMSNNPKALLSAPGFDQARFNLTGPQHMEVRLNR